MKPLGGAVLSGWLLALSLPPYNAEWLGWCALAPLFGAARGRRPLEAMGLAMLAGLMCGVVHARWHSNSHALLFAYLPFLWLAMLLGVVTALAEATRRIMTQLGWTFFVASVGVSAEWLTTFTPLPLNIALCQHRNLPVIQIADLTGIWGVSFLVWFANAAAACLCFSLMPGRRTVKPRLADTAVGVILLAGAAAVPLLFYGWMKLAHFEFNSDAARLRVAAIQDYTGTETADLAEPTSLQTESVDREAMTRRAAQRGAQFIVWSEGCLGTSFAPDAPRNPTADLARALNTCLVVGYTEPAPPKPFNCAALIAPDGKTVGVHRKMYLFMGEKQAVQPGRAARAFDVSCGTLKIRAGMLICFDNCFTHVTRRLVQDGAQIVAMPTFDPPTPRGVLHFLHAAVTPFRAVENRVPFVRCESNGLSQVVAASGRIVQAGPLYAPALLVADVVLGSAPLTAFTRWGDWWAYLCLLFSVVVGARQLLFSSPHAILTR
ncbi:MAG: hypothetical protein NZT92_07945 [Abditibacteriales bacterium]|nr:hypothetical protein [Abditibacteriales bacterium]MDW8367513.1 nitrilase-related carbon-nitrogen hydrolase [Abditibacteriales bacterium]